MIDPDKQKSRVIRLQLQYREQKIAYVSPLLLLFYNIKDKRTIKKPREGFFMT
jgi:hypothetical protein